jgi:hypothetical protein
VNAMECAREPEIVSVVLAGRWPDACDAELQVHVEACDVCSDVVTIAAVLHQDRELGRRDVQVPAAGQVWWRAAVRARLEGAHAAARPMTWLHGIAGACAAGLAAAATSVVWPSVERTVGWLSAGVWNLNTITVDVSELAVTVMQRSLPFALAAMVGIVITPIALYFALSDDW